MPGHLIACAVGNIEKLSVTSVVSAIVSELQKLGAALDEHDAIRSQIGFDKIDQTI